MSHSEKKTPRLNVSAGLVAALYAARLRRVQGDFHAAKRIYLDILERDYPGEEAGRFVHIITHMYLGEMFAGHLEAPAQAAHHFQKAAVPGEGMSPDWGRLVGVYADWSRFLFSEMGRKGAVSPAATVDPAAKFGLQGLLALHHLALLGAPTLLDRVGIHHEHGHVIRSTALKRGLSRIAASPSSKIDSTLALLALGDLSARAGSYDEAAGAYAELEGTYFAVEGRILRADCLYKMGKSPEARELLDQVRKDSPAYSQVVSQVQERWQKGGK